MRGGGEREEGGREDLKDLHGGELFGGGGMDPNGAQEVLVLETLPEGDGEALTEWVSERDTMAIQDLDDLSGVRSGDVDAQHLIVSGDMEHDLGHAGGAVVVLVGDCPLQRMEARHHTVDILRAILRDRSFLSETNGPQLQRGEDSGGDLRVLHELDGRGESRGEPEEESRPHGIAQRADEPIELRPATEDRVSRESSDQCESGDLDGGGSELRSTVDDVSDGVDARHRGLLIDADDLSIVWVCVNTNSGQVEARRIGVPPWSGGW
jgi:hypothetical protein